MSQRDNALRLQFSTALDDFSRRKHSLPGLNRPEAKDAFVEQLVESVHRVQYPQALKARTQSPRRSNPLDELFDPIRAAIIAQELGDVDEAFWLVFLFVHFGKHRIAGYRYVKEIYGRLGEEPRWSWVEVCRDPKSFRDWLHRNQEQILRRDGPRGFGSHRKYQSMDARATRGTGAVVESYVRWITESGSHSELFQAALEASHGDSKTAFSLLYRQMNVVVGFGRTARFDYLCMIGKLGLAKLEPDSAYLTRDNGPTVGAQLLFGSSAMTTLRALDGQLKALGESLGVGMQELEDALCNWQKSPNKFKAFRG
jgi:hypothetical protein